MRGAGAQRRQLYAAARGRRGLRREGPGGRHPLDADPAGKEGGIVRGSAARSRSRSRSRAGRALTAAAGCGRGPGSGTRRHPPRRSTAAPPFRRQGRGAAAAPPGGAGSGARPGTAPRTARTAVRLRGASALRTRLLRRGELRCRRWRGRQDGTSGGWGSMGRTQPLHSFSVKGKNKRKKEVPQYPKFCCSEVGLRRLQQIQKNNTISLTHNC